MEKPQLVMAMYRPHEGHQLELDDLVRQHYPTLKVYGLTTDQSPFIGRSSDGTILEVFEWASEEAAKKVHDHPAVAKIWEAMAAVCTFGRLEELPECKRVFPHFERFL